MNKKKRDIIFYFFILIGLSFVAYPTFNYITSTIGNSYVIASYNKGVSKINKEDKKSIIFNAKKYNKALYLHKFNLKSYRWKKIYYHQLNLNNSGIMGYIDINDYGIHLPIYHGSNDAVLQIGAGHLEYSSLPIGGRSTHAVISAHTGLPSARMFDQICKLKIGSYFQLRILNKTLDYKVDKISIVNPSQISVIKIEKNKDYCSLLTCTPMGINNKRLVIRGHRVNTRIKNNKSLNILKIIPIYIYVISLICLLFLGVIAYKKLYLFVASR